MRPAIVLAALLLGSTGPALRPTEAAHAAGVAYTITTLQAVTGETFTASNATNPVNGAGLIAGYVIDPRTGHPEAAVFDTRRSTVRHLGSLPGGVNSFAYDVNIRGDVVGSVSIAGAVSHAFAVRAGTSTMIELGSTDPGISSDAFSINDRGVIAGVMTGPASPLPYNYAVTWTLGAGTGFTTFNLGKAIGSTQSAAKGINNGGYILFSRWDKGLWWSYVWVPEHRYAMQIKPLPGDDNVMVNDMNNAGFVVGESWASGKGGVQRPILWNSQAQTTQLLPNIADSIGTIPMAINEYGTIVGNASVVKDNMSSAKPVVWDRFGANVANLPTGSNSSANVFGINVYGLVVGQLGQPGQQEGTNTWKPAASLTGTR